MQKTAPVATTANVATLVNVGIDIDPVHNKMHLYSLQQQSIHHSYTTREFYFYSMCQILST